MFQSCASSHYSLCLPCPSICKMHLKNNNKTTLQNNKTTMSLSPYKMHGKLYFKSVCLNRNINSIELLSDKPFPGYLRDLVHGFLQTSPILVLPPITRIRPALRCGSGFTPVRSILQWTEESVGNISLQ